MLMLAATLVGCINSENDKKPLYSDQDYALFKTGEYLKLEKEGVPILAIKLNDNNRSFYCFSNGEPSLFVNYFEGLPHPHQMNYFAPAIEGEDAEYIIFNKDGSISASLPLNSSNELPWPYELMGAAQRHR